MKKLRLGTRQSALALTQSQQVADALMACHPGLEVELAPILTRGDREKGDLAKIGGKGLFTEELEAGLLDGTFDFAVHSLKDLPVVLPGGLVVAAYPERVDERDVLVSEVAEDLDGLAPGSVVLTGSLRRGAQILARRGDVRVEPLRGNVDTRLRKWRESGHAGVILAAAGLERLGRDRPELLEIPAHPLDPEIMVPAPGQGILALEVKEGGGAAELCQAMNHPPSAVAAETERRIVTAFGGDCTLPLAAWARLDGDGVRLVAVLATPDGKKVARAETSGSDPEAVAAACVEEMRAAGAEEILAALGS